MLLSNPVPLLLPSWGVIIRSDRIVASNGKVTIVETHRSTLHPKDALKTFLSTHKKSFKLTSVLNICMPESMVSFDYLDVSSQKKSNIRAYINANIPNLSSVIWDYVTLTTPELPQAKVIVTKLKTNDFSSILESVKSAGLECDSLLTTTDLMANYFTQKELTPPTNSAYSVVDLDGEMATFSIFNGADLCFFRHQRSSKSAISTDLKETLSFLSQDSQLAHLNISHVYVTDSSPNASDIAATIRSDLGLSSEAGHFNNYDEQLAKLCAKTPHLMSRKRSLIPLSLRPKKGNMTIIIVAAILALILFALTSATQSFISKIAREAMEKSTALQISNTALISRYQSIKRAWTYDKELKRRVAYLTPKLAPPLIASFYLELSQIPTSQVNLKEIRMRQSKASLMLQIPSSILTNRFLDYIEALKGISSVKRVSYSVLGKAINGVTTVQVICELKSRGELANGK